MACSSDEVVSWDLEPSVSFVFHTEAKAAATLHDPQVTFMQQVMGNMFIFPAALQSLYCLIDFPRQIIFIFKPQLLPVFPSQTGLFHFHTLQDDTEMLPRVGFL